MTKSNINSIRLPELKDENQELIKELHELPNGWSINEKNEVLNELGLVMVNIEEEEEETEETGKTETEKGKGKGKGRLESDSLSISLNHQSGTKSDLGSKSYSLRKPIKEILDELEKEEIEEEKRNQLKLREAEEEEDLTSFSELEEDVGENFREETEEDLKEVLRKLDQEKEELKSWGTNGLEGLKNVFKSDPSKKVMPDLSLPSSSLKSSIPKENQDPLPSSLKTSKPKKSVSFAVETDSSEDTSTNPSNSTPSPPSLPTGGIMLPDIIEHPIEVSSPSLVKPKGSSINGKNAHLNPRLASLLPRSYVQSQHKPTLNSATDCTQTSVNEAEGSDEEYEEEYGLDDSEDDEGLYDITDEEDVEGEWPNDLHIQTALDMREAALEYHSKRQSLGMGMGTGSLGGEGVPMDENEEEEWVPIESRPKADGIPRQAPTTSRFKSGRLSKWKSSMVSSDPNHEEKTLVKEGKLFGTQPILHGPSPINGAAVYELPSRTEQSTELDEELTQEEIELLHSRLNILSMDEESRMVAERAGNELMGWMEKVKKGEVLIEDEIDQTEEEVKVGGRGTDEIGVLNLVKESEDLVHETNPMDGIPLRSDRPPEIKIVKKSNLKLDEKVSQNPMISSTTTVTDHLDPLHPTKESTLNPTLKSKEIKTNHVAKKVSRFKSEKLKQHAF